jgi:aspartate aminotransferase
MNIQLTARLNRISVSPTIAVMMEAELYRSRGIDVIDFGLGEPDFPTPEHLKRAGISAIEQNHTRYTATPGMMPLREAICGWHAAQFSSSYSAPECIVSAGGKHALFNIINALVDSGDEVVIPVPYWVSYPDLVCYAGGQPVFIQTHADDGFRLHPADVEAALTPRTKMVIVNSPNNPTGAALRPEDFERIYQGCKRHGVWLLSDETYSHLIYDAAKPYSVATIPNSKPNIIVAGSLSKNFSMTGWRIGYALAPQPLVQGMLKLQTQSTSNPSTISQYAALEAMRGTMDSVTTMVAEYARRRNHILEALRGIPGITCRTPEGAFYVFPSITALLSDRSQRSGNASDALELARQLIQHAHVAVVPGEAFGAPGHLRLSYATSIHCIDEGIARMTRFLTSSTNKALV